MKICVWTGKISPLVSVTVQIITILSLVSIDVLVCHAANGKRLKLIFLNLEFINQL